MKPKSAYPVNNIEGIDLQDENIKYVLLDSGTYKIDGEVISVSGSYYDKKAVGVKDFTDIRIVDTTTYIEKYVCGTEFKSVEDYEKEKDELLSKRKVRYEYDDETTYEWESLEDEFAYRKFIQLWQPINKTIQTISDPIEVAVMKIKTESGNKYITSCFYNGTDKDKTLFQYDRPLALQDIVKECFTELGMVFQCDCNYSATNNKKIWGNSTHSCIRYVTAFGTYIFGDAWDIRNSPKGKLKDLLKQYEDDKKAIRNIIISKYNKHFGTIDSGTFDFDRLLVKLRAASTSLQKVDSKSKTYDDYRRSSNFLKEAIEMINGAYSVKE